MTRQHTIAGPVHLAGGTLRSGATSSVELRPAEVDAGIRFLRDGVFIPARVDFVVDTRLATTLGRGGTTVSMVEHLCAALYAAGVDNVVVAVDADELPALDGSARPWLDLLEPAPQAAPRREHTVTEVVEVRHGDGWARLEPAEAFELDVTVEFDHPAIGTQRYRGRAGGAAFRAELAWARTFGFLADAERLRAAGLARGASLANTVVYDDRGVVNPEGLRAADEAVRHKALDAVGDAALLGGALRGRLVARRAGHTLHHLLLRTFLEGTAADLAAAR